MANDGSSRPQPKRRLGRGLGSLIGSPAPLAPTTSDPVPPDSRDSASASSSRSTSATIESKPEMPSESVDAPQRSSPDPMARVRMIRVDSITPNRRQPRQEFNSDALASLAKSIQKAGLMQPIVVRANKAGSASGDQFELIAGERRWRAVQRLDMELIPAVIREVDDRQAAEWALIENLQREDLNPMDRASAFDRLIQDFGLSHQEIAEEVGLDRSTVSNLLRLNELDAVTADAVRAGHLSLGHAKALLGCSDTGERQRVLQAVVRHGWSVRKTEAEVRRLSKQSDNTNRSSKSAVRSGGGAHIERLEEGLGSALGTRVHIKRGRKKGAGELVIEYYSLEQFEGLLERMKLSSVLADR